MACANRLFSGPQHRDGSLPQLSSCKPLAAPCPRYRAAALASQLCANFASCPSIPRKDSTTLQVAEACQGQPEP